MNFATFILYLVFLGGGINLCFGSIDAPGCPAAPFPDSSEGRHETSAPAIPTANSGCGLRAHSLDGCVGANVSDAAGACDRSLRSRRSDRHPGAPYRTKIIRISRKTVLRREHRRCRWQYRHGSGSESGTRRLYGPCGSAKYRRQPGHVRHGTLRSLQGLRPGNDCRHLAHGAHGPSVTGSPDRQGSRCVDQIRSRQIQLRFSGDRDTATSHWRALPPVARPRPCARALQQRGLGSRRNARRAYAHCLHLIATCRAADQGRQAARAGCDEQDAVAGPAGGAQHGGSRLS